MSERIINKTTGTPVSEQMQATIDACAGGEAPPIFDIMAIPEVVAAERQCSDMTETMLDNSLYRQDMRDDIESLLLRRGSIGSRNANGGQLYNGPVERARRLDIVIGLPASGKSSALAEGLSREYRSRIVDNDDAKAMLPEYQNGTGAGVVHRESKLICDNVFAMSVLNGDNIVLPKLGDDPEYLMRSVSGAISAGYSVHVHLVDLPKEKALGRMLSRFVETGRYINPAVLESAAPADDPGRMLRSYRALELDPRVDGCSMWSNDVDRGCPPVPLEVAGHENPLALAAASGAPVEDVRAAIKTRPGGESRHMETPELAPNQLQFDLGGYFDEEPARQAGADGAEHLPWG